MKFRFTMKQLADMSDNELLRALVAERKSTLNIYKVLYTRLNRLYNKLDDEINKERRKHSENGK